MQFIYIASQSSESTQPSSFLWTITGGVLGLLVGIGYWLTSPEEAYQLISALTLGWSLSLAWTQLVAFGYGRIGRITGVFAVSRSGNYVHPDSQCLL